MKFGSNIDFEKRVILRQKFDQQILLVEIQSTIVTIFFHLVCKYVNAFI